jgi:MFS family permease
MLAKFQSYPRAYWLLMTIFFFNRIGASFIWPFMALFIREQTAAPLKNVTELLSIQAIASLIGSPFVASLMDRYGRKKLMLFGLVAYSATLLVMSQATQLWQWAFLMAIYGIMHPIFYVGAYAMVADLSTLENRTEAFAILRMISNLSIALGPAIGGVLIARSHNFAFFATIAINAILFIPFALLMSETLSKRKPDTSSRTTNNYRTMLRDRPFIAFIIIFTLLEIAIALVFNLLSIYTKENFGIAEDQYGQILAINAAMVVLFQYGVTRITARYRHLPVMAAGALFYVAGLVSFAQSGMVLHFMFSMVILTIGELIAMPTANALVANMAPSDMRARYLGVLSLTFTFGTGIGPVFTGCTRLYSHVLCT